MTASRMRVLVRYFFFFSSRRRHTRYWRDWSSDVCSSDLWIGFSHFEGDECGSLNEWLRIAPQAQAVCSIVGAATSVQDFAIRPPRAMQHDEVLATGRYRFRFRQTPHVPHCWDAGLLFEEVERTLLASDLFFHDGDVEPRTTSDIVGRTQRALAGFTSGPLAVPIPYTQDTERILHGLADLMPRTIATHHGSAFVGDGERALRDLRSEERRVGKECSSRWSPHH